MTRPTTILGIEHSNPGAPAPADASSGPGVCLTHDDRLIAHAPLTPRDRHDDALLPAIDAVCREAGIGSQQIDRVGVSVGPGGYTAIRIGVTVTKTIAEATGCACVGVPTAHAVCRATSPTGAALVALAWKRDDVWVQDYTDGAPEDSGRIVPISALSSHAQGRTLIAEQRLLDQTSHTGAHAHPVFSAHAIAMLAQELEPVDPRALLPLYPREPEAVRKWRATRRV